MKRKVALMASAEGPWVRTGDMETPHVKVSFPEGTVLGIFGVDAPEPFGATGWMKRIETGGVHRLNPVRWMKVVVLEGPCVGIRCVIQEAA